MDYDKDRDEDAGYDEFVEWLIEGTCRRFLQDGGESAVTWYLENAYKASLSGDEVIDFFCVSSDSVCDRLSADDQTRQVLTSCFDRLNPTAFRRRYG
jgi:hypothetical protein